MSFLNQLDHGLDKVVGEGRLPALIAAVAANDGREEGQVTYYGKVLRQGGLVESHGTGLGAPKMTLADAVTVLLAMCGSYYPTAAPTAVANLRRLTALQPDEFDKGKRAESKLPEALRWLNSVDRFSDVLAGLIFSAPALKAWEESYEVDQESDRGGLSAAEFAIARLSGKFRQAKVAVKHSYARSVRVVFYLPGRAAEVHLGRSWLALEEDDAFHQLYADQGGPQAPDAAFDVQGAIEIGTSTLLALHDAWKTKPKHPRQIARERRRPV